MKEMKNYINGSWRETKDLSVTLNPWSGKQLALVPVSGKSEVQDAALTAKNAQTEWAEVSPQERGRVLMQFRDLLDKNRKNLARTVTENMGKTLDDAEAEVGRGIESVEAALAVPHLLKGENLQGIARGMDVEMIREPVGVVAAITPFNFPVMIPLWFVPFALACGNAIILKPSERDPLPSEEIFRILEKLDLPKGLVSLLHGGRETVQAILEERAIDAISFVGQASTARTIATEGVRHGKRVQALGGAKNSAILMPDAKLDQAVPAVLSSAFEAAGQRCLASSVLIVVGSKKEREASIDRVLQASKKLKSGNGKSKTTDVCPLISPEARERAIRAIREAEASGAKVLLDGRNVGNDAGTLLGPTLVASQRPEIALFKEEIFAPVLAVYEAETLEEAIRFSNETEYGNSGAIFTESAAAVREYKRGIAAGMLGVNIGVPAPIAWFPFAGHKASIDGDLHANGIDAVEFYTRKKVVTSRWQ